MTGAKTMGKKACFQLLGGTKGYLLFFLFLLKPWLDLFFPPLFKGKPGNNTLYFLVKKLE